MEKKGYHKDYYESHRDEILKGMYRKVRCESCGTTHLFCNLKKHQRTKRHLRNSERERDRAEILVQKFKDLINEVIDLKTQQVI